jgi:hypothetical protein
MPAAATIRFASSTIALGGSKRSIGRPRPETPSAIPGRSQ